MLATPSPSGPQRLSFAALAATLASLSMLAPFSIDAYLPAFPNIQRELMASPLQVQQSLTAYLFAFSTMVLWHGPLSDAYGRRRVILCALGVFALATIGCALAPTIEFLWAFRILQGLSSGAGSVVGRALIRDWYEGPQATRLMSLVSMIFSIAPAIAPIIGGLILTQAGWRSIFWFLLLYVSLLFIYCYHFLPESLPQEKRQPVHPMSMLKNVLFVLSTRRFLMVAGPIALNFSGFFLYVAAAPVFILQHLQLGPKDFFWIFVPTMIGMFLGAMTANRMAGKRSISSQIRIGFMLMLSGAIVNSLYHAVYPPSIPWSVLPLMAYSLGSSIIAPAATLVVLDLFPDIRGAAASCQSFFLTMLAALMAGIGAPLMSSSALSMAISQLSMILISLTLWSMAERQRRRAKGQAK